MSVLREHLKNAKVTLDDAKTDLSAQQVELKRVEAIKDDLLAQIEAFNIKADKAAANNATARIQGTQLFEGLHNTEAKIASLRRETAAIEVHMEKQAAHVASASASVLTEAKNVEAIAKDLAIHLTSELTASQCKEHLDKAYALYRQLNLSVNRLGGSQASIAILQECAAIFTWKDSKMLQPGKSVQDLAVLRQLDYLCEKLINSPDYEL